MKHQELQKYKHFANSLEPKGYLWENKGLKEKLKTNKLKKEIINFKKQAKNMDTWSNDLNKHMKTCSTQQPLGK